MKFNEEELQRFREDFKEEIKFLEKKYAINITLGNIINDDTFFSARITAEHAKKEDIVIEPKERVQPKKENVQVSQPQKKIVKHVEEEVSEPQKIDPKAKQLAKEIIHKKPRDVEDEEEERSELRKAARKVISNTEEEPKKKKIKLNELDLANLTDEEIEALDLDSIELDEEAEALLDELDTEDEALVRKPKKVMKPEPKPVKKEKPLRVEPKKPVEKKKLHMSDLADLTDEEIDSLNLDEYEIIEDEPKPAPSQPLKQVKKDFMDEPDIEEISDDEFEEVKFRDENPEDFYDEEETLLEEENTNSYDDMDLDDFFDEKEEEPKSIFDEKVKTPQRRVNNYDDIDDILSSGGRYSYSFEAKMIQSEGLIQDYYTSVKNEILGYKGMSSRVSWDNDTFSYAKTPLARINIENDMLTLYLALDCDEYQDSKYNFSDASSDRRYAATPMKFIVRKFKDVNEACELIQELMDSFGIENEGPLYDDYHSDYETKEELIDRGLIKKI